MSGQSSDQNVNFLVDVPAAGRNGGDRTNNVQLMSASRRGSPERSQIYRMAAEASEDVSACVCFKRDMPTEPGRNRCWRYGPSLSFCFASAQARSNPQVWG